MSLTAAVGESGSWDAREAGQQAAQKALTHLGRASVGFGIVVVPHEYDFQEVMEGVTGLLGDSPVLATNTSASVTSSGQHRRSVAVALLAGSDLQARAGWWAASASEDKEAAHTGIQKLVTTTGASGRGVLLLAGEGSGEDGNETLISVHKGLENLRSAAFPPVSGCLAGGQTGHELGRLFGGHQSGKGGLAAAWLTGGVTAGIGADHGWNDVGMYARITEVEGRLIKSIDHRTAAEAYANWFGRSSQEWGSPPLNELVRLYPFGIEAPQASAPGLEPSGFYQVRSPLCMKTGGGLLMNVTVEQDSVAHLLLGSPSSCLEAARRAAQHALSELQDSSSPCKPVLGIVWIDEAWRMLMEAQPGEEIRAVSEVIGPDVPVIGGYTLGQIGRQVGHAPSRSLPQLLNQHILVALLAEEVRN